MVEHYEKEGERTYETVDTQSKRCKKRKLQNCKDVKWKAKKVCICK